MDRDAAQQNHRREGSAASRGRAHAARVVVLASGQRSGYEPIAA